MSKFKDYCVDDLLFEAVFEACSVHDEKGRVVIDTMCVGAFEDACAYLVSVGYLSTVNGRVHYLVVPKNKVFKAAKNAKNTGVVNA